MPSRGNRLRLRDLVFVLAATTLSAHPQSPAPAGPDVDAYSGFVGDWIGTVRYLSDDTYITQPVLLHIAEMKAMGGLRLEYTYPAVYGHRATREKRVLRFDPDHEKLTLHYGAFDDGEFDTTGLAAFARTGYGAFQASAIPLQYGVPVAYRVEYLLTQNTLLYTWHRSVSHGPFVTIHHIEVHRVGSQP